MPVLHSMDIKAALIAEHSKSQTLKIVNYINGDKKRFKELMKIFLGSDYRVTQRAAWPLSYTLLENPQLLSPWYSTLIKKLREPGLHPSVPRNILRVFQEMDIPEAHQGEIVDQCFKFIASEAEPVAVRAFAITTAANICRLYPELKKELIIILTELNQLPQQAAIKHRVKTALKVLRK